VGTNAVTNGIGILEEFQNSSRIPKTIPIEL
jgi:hypothetical protein